MGPQLLDGNTMSTETKADPRLVKALPVAIELLAELKAARSAEVKLECYYTGKCDSNQSTFEQLTTQNLLGVWAASTAEAQVLFGLIRFIVDRNPFELLDFSDMEYTSAKACLQADEVTTTPNLLIGENAPAETGVALSMLAEVTHPAVMMDVTSIDRLLSTFKA